VPVSVAESMLTIAQTRIAVVGLLAVIAGGVVVVAARPTAAPTVVLVNAPPAPAPIVIDRGWGPNWRSDPYWTEPRLIYVSSPSLPSPLDGLLSAFVSVVGATDS
jgi:hypothetical protein